MTLAQQPSRRSRVWLAVWLIYWLGSFVLTHIPVPRGVRLPSGGDKVVHVLLYAGLTLLGGAALSARRSLSPRLLLSWAIVYLAYGAADEWLQSFVGRTASVADWTADAVGVLVATGIFCTWKGKKARPEAQGQIPSARL